MGKSSERLRNFLEALIKDKKITITELEKKAKIPRPSIYGYLKGAIPDLDALDKIADATDQKPWQVIQPDEEKGFVEKILPSELIFRISRLTEDQQKRIVETFGLQVKDYESMPEKTFIFIPPEFFKRVHEELVLKQAGIIPQNLETTPFWAELMKTAEMFSQDDLKDLLRSAKIIASRKKDQKGQKETG